MDKKLLLVLMVAVVALGLSVASYLPTQVAKGGEAACPALKTARDKLFARDPNHPSLPGLDKAIANNCPAIGDANCAQDFGLTGVGSQCYTDSTSCAVSGALACLEPSSTCLTSSGGTKSVCGIFL